MTTSLPSSAPTIQPVILCGGSGSRLWPLSRTNLPKPFVALTGETTLFQQALERVSGMAAPLVICAESQRFLVMEQAKTATGLGGIMLEPSARNTGPACLLAALHIAETQPQTVLALLPADHVIADTAAFQDVLRQGAVLAQQGKVVLFGVTPAFAHGEYGYIQGRASGDAEGVQLVTRFVEKPGVAGATALLQDGGYFWNSGIFLVRADVMIAELATHRPEMVAAGRAALAGMTREDTFGVPLLRLPDNFDQLPSEPIDKALHEETDAAVMIPFSGSWSDVGNWDAVLGEMTLDGNRNSLEGQVYVHGVHNALVRSFAHGLDGLPGSKPVAVVGLSDVVVVDCDDATLVLHRGQAAQVKDIVQAMQRDQRTEVLDNRRVLRPWGWYETLQRGPGFLVKRIQVKPGAQLSLQYHHHRAEHWVCVRGEATVTRGEETVVLQPDQSTYLPQGIAHRLANHTHEPVEIIEVQTGRILEESDIVRLEDVYGRAEPTKS